MDPNIIMYLASFTVAYLLSLVIVHWCLFKNAKVGDRILVFLGDNDLFYESDVIVDKDEENNIIFTEHHGGFTIYDYLSGAFSIE